MDAQPSDNQEIAPGARIAPAPAWVQLEDYAIPSTPNPHFIANGLSTLLDEVQVDLCGAERAWFHRRADLVTAHAGAEQAAQFNTSFDPAYEHVDIHSIKVIRDGQIIDHTNPEKFQVLRREQNLERLIHDGRVTIHYAIPDVRPGDTVETAVTIYGMRKSLAGRHSTWMLFEWGFGIVDLRVRQRAPAQRRIHERRYNNTPEPKIIEADGVTDKRWRVSNRLQVRAEMSAPPWTIQHAAIQFSEWTDWGEVVSAFLPLYTEDAPLPADLEQEIQKIADAETTLEGRAAAVLRLTQTAVRYLAISMGEGGYTPRPLDETWAARYGDCKDKSKLFVAIARRLGLEAYPALVDTRSGYRLNDILPTAEAFDHCIVKLVIGEAIYWIDPTRARQLSPLEALSQCHFGWALPLKDGATLERMADPTPVHSMETNERIDLGPTPDDRVRYEWRVTSRRGRAEWVRETVAREGAVGMFKMYAQDVQRAFPLAEPVKQDVENDDLEKNEISIIEVYDLPQAWTDIENNAYQFSTLDLSMKSNLAPLQAGMPRHQIYLGQIGKVSRRVEIHMANSMKLDPWERKVEASTLSFTNRFSKAGPRLAVLEQVLEFRALTLPASEADKYRAICAELEKNDLALRDVVNKKGVFLGAAPAERSKGNGWVFYVVWIGLVLAYIAYDTFVRQGATP
jgi:transglutaminase-like putative cysteine protease